MRGGWHITSFPFAITITHLISSQSSTVASVTHNLTRVTCMSCTIWSSIYILFRKSIHPLKLTSNLQCIQSDKNTLIKKIQLKKEEVGDPRQDNGWWAWVGFWVYDAIIFCSTIVARFLPVHLWLVIYPFRILSI